MAACASASVIDGGRGDDAEEEEEDDEEEAAPIFADVAQPDQARIVALNAQYFLKTGGNFIISIKANCIDSTVPAEAVFAREVKKLQQEQFKPAEQLTLEPYERDHAIVTGSYRVGKKKSKD